MLKKVKESDILDTTVIIKEGNCLDKMNYLEEGSIDLIWAHLPSGTKTIPTDYETIDLDEFWRLAHKILRPNGRVIMMAREPYFEQVIASNPSEFQVTWYWNRVHPHGGFNATNGPMYIIQPIAVFLCNRGGEESPYYSPQGVMYKKKKSKEKTWFDEEEKIFRTNNPTQLVTFDHHEGKGYVNIHPQQQPEPLVDYFIRTYTKPGDTVLDVGMGSGTVGAVCVKNDRNFIGYEISSKYFKAARKRLKQVMNEKQLGIVRPN